MAASKTEMNSLGLGQAKKSNEQIRNKSKIVKVRGIWLWKLNKSSIQSC